MRILVAEDQTTNLWLIQHQLQHLGCLVTAVSSGRAALAALADAKYDLLITDCHMPEMDGVELTRRIRESEAALGAPRLPVLALSADVTLPMRERCLAAGMDDFVTKPVDLTRLQTAIVRTTLGHKAVPAALESSTAAGMSSAAMVFDSSAYRELFRDEHAEGRAWLASYLDAATALLQQIREAVADGDRKALKARAHQLAGASLSVGAMIFGALCRELETAAAQAPKAEIEQLMDPMQGTFAAARAEIAQFVQVTVELVAPM
jgi:CheY-like chemotaxis protein